MSCPDILWALEQGRERGLSASARMVLIALADRANGARLCWPSLPTIAVDTGLSVRQAQTVTHKLEALGLVRRELRGRSMHYFILRPFPSPASEPEPQKSTEPRQPLPDSVTIEPRQPLPHSEPEPRQPLPDDPGNFVQMNAATIAAKPIKKNLSRNLRRAGAREGGANAGLEGKEASKQLDGAGLSATEHSAATAWLRHVCGGTTAREELSQRLATVRKYANPAYRWLKGHVPMAAEIADGEGWYDQPQGRSPPPAPAPPAPPAADSRTPAEIASAMSREISGKAHAPGAWAADRNTQIEQLSERRVKPAYLPRELLPTRSMMGRVAVPA